MIFLLTAATCADYTAIKVAGLGPKWCHQALPWLYPVPAIERDCVARDGL